jgi:hypothetical protein
LHERVTLRSSNDDDRQAFEEYQPAGMIRHHYWT